MATDWESTQKKITNQNSKNSNMTNRDIKNDELTKQATDNAISGSMLSSRSQQQKIAMIAGFAILALLLALYACSKESPKPALAGVSSPIPAAVTPAGSIGEAASSTAAALPTPGKKTAKKRPANVTYSDANSGVSFSIRGNSLWLLAIRRSHNLALSVRYQ